MGAGNTNRREGPTVTAVAVYSDVSPKVIDDYNTALMEHLERTPLTVSSNGRSSWSYSYYDRPTYPHTTSHEYDHPTGTYPKLLGNKVMMLSFED